MLEYLCRGIQYCSTVLQFLSTVLQCYNTCLAWYNVYRATTHWKTLKYMSWCTRLGDVRWQGSYQGSPLFHIQVACISLAREMIDLSTLKRIASYKIQNKIWLLASWSLTSWPNLKVYMEGHHLGTVCIHDNILRLPNWKNRPIAPTPALRLSHIFLEPNLPGFLFSSDNAKHRARNQQV